MVQQNATWPSTEEGELEVMVFSEHEYSKVHSPIGWARFPGEGGGEWDSTPGLPTVRAAPLLAQAQGKCGNPHQDVLSNLPQKAHQCHLSDGV